MGFRSFVEKRKIEKQLPKNLERHSISTVITHAPSTLLESFVIEHFDSILSKTNSYQYHLFKNFESWKRLFMEKSKMIFEMQKDFCDFQKL
jgi:hypothetical protein